LDSPTPPKCLECVKFYQHRPHATCRVCRDFGIEEKLLCDLNRMIQKPDPFHCHAFQPRLKLAGQAVAAQPTTPRPTPPRSQLQFVRDFLKSDKIKYQKALALQKLGQEPDEIIVNLKYHLLWNTAHRRPVFTPPKTYFENLFDLFLGFGELVGGMVALMWLASDHIHIYVETDGEKSLEAIAKKLKAASYKAILGQFRNINEKLPNGGRLWDKAYFLETQG
jgi:REP element-mobilizing transposase RayT